MKQYDEKKVCFIICTNNEQQLQECLLYLNLLEIPEGFTTEVLTILDAKSMTAGYNEGMRASDAKYKVYLHQDTFIIEKQFIKKIIKIFNSDPEIGMIGSIGAESLSKDAVMWHEERCGNFYRLEQLIEGGFDDIQLLKKGKKEVQVIDGFLMITQYDLSWRDDIFKGWDFYDVSQCMEFRKAGYKIVVPAQYPLWVIHACGAPSFWHYNKNRELALKEYPEILEQNKDEFRILFFKSDVINIAGLAYNLELLGNKVTVPEYQVHLHNCIDAEVEIIEEYLEEGHYDLVVTYDFAPGVAEACHNMNVKYYAWVYDYPLLELYMKQAEYPTNYVTVFDKKQFERMSKENLKHLYYQPLASEGEWFRAAHISKKDEKKYKVDISFVGRLYDKRGYEELFDENTKELKGEADTIVSSCNCCWTGKEGIYNKASDKLIEHIASKYSEEEWSNFHVDKRYYCESMKLVRKCNEIERVTILNTLAKNHQVVLYTDDVEKTTLQNVRIEPWVDYYNIMPKVFYLSKINLNITSRSIESGVPQRVWDILSVGGFCLTNYQPELEDFFEIGKDLEVYHNLDELVEKVDYYLKHEKERVRIAINGYQKVKEQHDSKTRLKTILQEIFPKEADCE